MSFSEEDVFLFEFRTRMLKLIVHLTTAALRGRAKYSAVFPNAKDFIMCHKLCRIIHAPKNENFTLGYKNVRMFYFKLMNINSEKFKIRPVFVPLAL